MSQLISRMSTEELDKHEHDWRPVTEINNQGQVQQCIHCGKVRDTRKDNWDYGVIEYTIVGGLFFYAAFMVVLVNKTAVTLRDAIALYFLSILAIALIPLVGMLITEIWRMINEMYT